MLFPMAQRYRDLKDFSLRFKIEAFYANEGEKHLPVFGNKKMSIIFALRI